MNFKTDRLYCECERTKMIEYVLFGICVLLLMLPSKYDPAIMLKEWLANRKKDDV